MEKDGMEKDLIYMAKQILKLKKEMEQEKNIMIMVN